LKNKNFNCISFFPFLSFHLHVPSGFAIESALANSDGSQGPPWESLGLNRHFP